MYQRQVFKDRDAVNQNKRRITVLEQNANEIIANIEPVAEEIKEEGTPFNAELMEKFQDSIIQSETDSGEALKIANEAKTQSQEAFNRVVSAQGTKVTKNGELVASFEANEKTDQVEFVELKQRVLTWENSSVMTKIQYDPLTNTFNM